MPIDFRARDYFAPITLLEIGRAFARLQWAERSELHAYQVQRLRVVLQHAQRRIPYWSKTFAAARFEPRKLISPADMTVLPELQKSTLRERGEELIESGTRHPPSQWHATSGTTGRPVRFLLDRRSNALEFCFYRRAWSWGGYRLGQAFAELGGHHFLARGRDPEQLLQWQPALRRLMINANRLGPARVDEVRDALARHQPRFLKGLPTALDHLARCFGQRGGVHWAFEAVFSGGEVVTPATRSRIERAFGCRLFDSYGHMERTVAASQCAEGSYHVHEDYGLLELRDSVETADGRRLGTVLGTGLHNLAMPLVRYEVGDTLELAPEGMTCACGRGLRIATALHGRSVDVVTTVDGRALTALTTAFDHVPGIDVLQLVQRAPDALELRIVPGPAWSDASQRELLEAGARAVGAGLRLEVELVAREGLVGGGRGKLRPVVGLCAEDRA